MLQEIITWGQLKTVSFEMTLTTDEKKMEYFLFGKKYDMIITADNKEASKFLTQKNIKFAIMNPKKGGF